MNEHFYWLSIAYLIGLAFTLWMFVCAIDSAYASGGIFKFKPGEFRKSWPAAITWPLLWIIIIVHVLGRLHLILRSLRKERKKDV